MPKPHDLDLPVLPALHERKTQPISNSQFTRRKLQGLLHIMTAELKNRGTKTPHIFLPFRSRVDDAKLNLFLRRVFPDGNMVDTANKAIVRSLLSDFDEFTLICGLKYLWCRLPNNEIIGWPVYLEFKRREQEAGYPKDAFLTIMPKCLSSSSHASIVYDFLDLMISIASNTQYNHINGRKVSKMASMWAFKSSQVSTSAFYDATLENESSFLEGLEAWKKTCNGLFHLLLSFLRAMLPDTEAETLNLPKTLQSLLVSNTYPPPDDNRSVKSAITIPCVHIRSTRKSADPYELISKVRHTLSFEKKDSFLSIENFTILKNIFQKSSTAEIVSTLSEESRRVLTRLTAEPVPSEFDIYPGWAHRSSNSEDLDIPLYSEVTITNISLQDYYIWTWLSSLGSDQTENIKSLFGRSIVVEAGLRGFQKWMVLTETSISPDEYISIFRNPKHEVDIEHYSRSPQISPLPKSIKGVKETPALSESDAPTIKLKQQQPLPRLPLKKNVDLPPTPHESPLPDVSFTNDQFSFEDQEFSQYGNRKDELHNSDFGSVLSKSFDDKMKISSKKKPMRRPRPPPLDLLKEQSLQPKQNSDEPAQIHIADISPADPYSGSIPVELEDYHSYYAPDSAASVAQRQYEEPFEKYNTAFELERQDVSSEPFDNYQVPGESTRNMSRAAVHENYSYSKARKGSSTRELNRTGDEKQLPSINFSDSREFEIENSSDRLHSSNESGLSARGKNIPRGYHNSERNHDTKEEILQTKDALVKNESIAQYEGKGLVETPYPNDTDTLPLFSGKDNEDGKAKLYSGSPLLMQENSGYPFYENVDKVKKSKKKSKKKELAAMLANNPDAPPPPLPTESEPTSSSHADILYRPGNDTELFLDHEEFGLQPEQRGRDEYDSSNFGSATRPQDISSKAEAFNLNEEKPPTKEKRRKKPRSPHLRQPEDWRSPSHSSEFSFDHKVTSLSEFDNVPLTSSAQTRETSNSFNKSGLAAQVAHTNASGDGLPISGLGLSIDESSAHETGGYYGAYGDINSSPRYDYSNERSFSSGAETILMPPGRDHRLASAVTGSHSPVERNSAHADHTMQQTGNAHLQVPSSGYSGFDPGFSSSHMVSHSATPNDRGVERKQELSSKPNSSVLPYEPSSRVQGIQRNHTPPRPAGVQTMPISSVASPYVPAKHAPVPYMPPQNPSMKPQHYHTNQPVNTQLAPQYYYPPPSQGYYHPPPPPPQGYGHPQAPIMYYPPPGGYYGPPAQHQGSASAKSKPSTSELAMMNMPTANTFKKNSKPNKANLRAALNQGGFGI